MKRKELIEICDDGIRKEKEAADSLEAGSTERLNAVRTLKEYQSIRKEEKESVVKYVMRGLEIAGTTVVGVLGYAIGYAIEKEGNLCSRTFAEFRGEFKNSIKGLFRK